MTRPARAVFAPLLLSLFLLAACAPAPDSTQTPVAEQTPAPAQTPPAGPSRPDFSGVWMAFAVENPDGGGGMPTYSAEGAAMLDAFVARYREIPETGLHCVATGMPGVMLSTVSYPIEILQTQSRILMVAELEHQVRRVFLDGREHPTDTFPSGVGHSVGRWDGDTLVIDTALLEEWELRAWPRSSEAHIVERWNLTTFDAISARPSGFVGELDAAISDEVLVVDITLTDPVYYDGPQRRLAYYQRVADSAAAEYGCSNGLWRDLLDEQRIR